MVMLPCVPSLTVPRDRYHVNVLNIKRIYLYDNNSTVPMLPFILPFIQAGIVVYEYFSLNPPAYGPRPQFYAYVSCMERYARYHVSTHAAAFAACWRVHTGQGH